jgi:hypothetical protein
VCELVTTGDVVSRATSATSATTKMRNSVSTTRRNGVWSRLRTTLRHDCDENGDDFSHVFFWTASQGDYPSVSSYQKKTKKRRNEKEIVCVGFDLYSSLSFGKLLTAPL